MGNIHKTILHWFKTPLKIKTLLLKQLHPILKIKKSIIKKKAFSSYIFSPLVYNTLLTCVLITNKKALSINYSRTTSTILEKKELERNSQQKQYRENTSYGYSLILITISAPKKLFVLLKLKKKKFDKRGFSFFYTQKKKKKNLKL